MHSLLQGTKLFNGIWKPVYGGAAFGTMTAVEQAIINGEVNSKDVIVSSLLGGALGMMEPGALRIPKNVLNITGKFSESEWGLIKTHLGNEKFWTRLETLKRLQASETGELSDPEMFKKAVDREIKKLGDYKSIAEFINKLDEQQLDRK